MLAVKIIDHLKPRSPGTVREHPAHAHKRLEIGLVVDRLDPLDDGASFSLRVAKTHTFLSLPKTTVFATTPLTSTGCPLTLAG